MPEQLQQPEPAPRPPGEPARAGARRSRSHRRAAGAPDRAHGRHLRQPRSSRPTRWPRRSSVCRRRSGRGREGAPIPGAPAEALRPDRAGIAAGRPSRPTPPLELMLRSIDEKLERVPAQPSGFEPSSSGSRPLRSASPGRAAAQGLPGGGGPPEEPPERGRRHCRARRPSRAEGHPPSPAGCGRSRRAEAGLRRAEGAPDPLRQEDAADPARRARCPGDPRIPLLPGPGSQPA